MKLFIAATIALLLTASPLLAQNTVLPCVKTAGGCAPVTSTNPLPVSIAGLDPYLGLCADISKRPYSAVADGGVTDNTAAFNSAFASNWCVAVPVTTLGYGVADLVIPSYHALVGYSGTTQRQHINPTSRLVPTSTATNIIDDSTTQGVFITHMDFYGGGYAGGYPSYGSNVGCFKSGMYFHTLISNTIRFCGNGGISGTDYTHTLFAFGNTWYGNGNTATVYAASRLIDAIMIGDTFAANYGGVYVNAGADSNYFNNMRFEFNNHFGLWCYQCGKNSLVNNQFDRNFDGDLKLNGTNQMTVVGGWAYRSGRNNTSGKNASIYWEGNNDQVTISNMTFRHGCDDGGCTGGGNVDTPAYVQYFNSSTDTNILFVNNQVEQGYVTSFIGQNGSAFPLSYSQLGNPSEPDTVIGELLNKDNFGFYYSKYVNKAIADTASFDFTVALPSIAASSQQNYELVVDVRNSTSGVTYSGFYHMLQQRGSSGGASLVFSALMGETGASGAIQFGGGLVNLATSAVATDGSSFTLTPTNSAGAGITFSYWLKPL